MAWLVRGGEVLASLEVAGTRNARRWGLLGRDGIEGALLIPKAHQVHTIGMRFPVDVAYCDADLVVIRVGRLERNRIGPVVWSARAVIEAEAGMLGRWNVQVGDQLETRGTDQP